jgi:hypothetical protein
MKHSKSNLGEPFITIESLACMPQWLLFAEERLSMACFLRREGTRYNGTGPGVPEKASWLRNSDEIFSEALARNNSFLERGRRSGKTNAVKSLREGCCSSSYREI